MTDTPENTTLVVFGGTGDLTRRKLIPSLFSLFLKGRLPSGVRIVGVARDQVSTEEFRASLQQSPEQLPGASTERAKWEEFASRIGYLRGDVASSESLEWVNQELSQFESASAGGANRLYYLALPPSLYGPTITNLSESGLAAESEGWRRVIIEKPFGTDLASACELNRVVSKVLRENQVFRIDHYLGKETVQNLLVFRFANAIFEPIWNRNYIDHVQITVTESVSASERAGYYDQTGVLRDMFQNHLLQLLSLVSMEPPNRFEADSLRDEKVKVLNAVRRINAEEATCHTVQGQYQGYLSEGGVSKDSTTPTFAALRLYVDNWRWQGVPFYLRSGKAMAEKTTEIIIQFRCPPHLLFPLSSVQSMPPNTLSICIQPDEGFHLQFQAKTPDAGMEMQPVDLEFHYQSGFADHAIPEAYERLLLDALMGDASLFTRSDEIEQAWEIIDPIIAGLGMPGVPPPDEYLPGEWGPASAERFIEADGRKWLRGCADH